MAARPGTERITLRRLAPILAIAVIAVAGYFTLGDVLGFDSLRQHRAALIEYRDAHYLLAVAGFMLAYILIVAFSLPGGAVASLTGGFLFGLFPGALYNIVAATIGATLIFLAARHGLGEVLARRMDASEGRMKAVRDGLKRNELSFLLLMRLVPAVPFFAANLIPALFGVSLGRFVVTTVVGIIPGGVVYTWIGAGLGEVFARGESPDLGLIFEPYILGPILGLCALALLPVLVKSFRKEPTA
ncbi:MAG: TVP38/TMEM64 family protein [Rhodobacteraceae bacterium]|nr:TVP38/TMEM64 family protein [Paracoccaceae bacterium]